MITNFSEHIQKMSGIDKNKTQKFQSRKIFFHFSNSQGLSERKKSSIVRKKFYKCFIGILEQLWGLKDVLVYLETAMRTLDKDNIFTEKSV